MKFSAHERPKYSRRRLTGTRPTPNSHVNLDSGSKIPDSGGKKAGGRTAEGLEGFAERENFSDAKASNDPWGNVALAQTRTMTETHLAGRRKTKTDEPQRKAKAIPLIFSGNTPRPVSAVIVSGPSLALLIHPPRFRALAGQSSSARPVLILIPSARIVIRANALFRLACDFGHARCASRPGISARTPRSAEWFALAPDAADCHHPSGRTGGGALDRLADRVCRRA